MGRSPSLVIAFVLAAAVLVPLACADRKNRLSPPPLMGSVHRPSTKNKRPAECHFAGKTYELQDMWHPDLGPPFGTQFCVRCECVEIKKKRRVIGKVHCRNFKSECSKPLCQEPVLLPGQCCKSCPQNPDEARDIPTSMDGEEDNKQSNEYAALLTGLEMIPPVATSVIGSGRFTFSKRNLHYSIYLGRNEHLAYIRFVDEGGTILEEQEINMEAQKSKNGKICGVWRRIPKIYRKILREERLFAELVSNVNSEGLIRGRLARYRSLQTESFSALLKPSSGLGGADGGGGLAIISTVSTTASIIHVQLIFNGIVSEKDPELTQLELRVVVPDKPSGPPLIEELAKIHSPNKKYNSLEWKMELSPKELRSVLLGKAVLTIAPRHKPEYRLEGPIVPNSKCNIFQAVLSNANSLTDNQPPLQSSGLAVITVNDDTTLNYSVYLHGLTSRVLALTLESHQKKRRQIIDNLLPNLNDNWANGTYTKTTPRDLEMLLTDELFVNVDTEHHEGELRGQVVQRLNSDAHAAASPMLLAGADDSAATGLAWLTVDGSCKLAFDVLMAGVGGPRAARDKGSAGSAAAAATYLLKIVESAPSNARAEKRLLAEFTGNEVEDVVDDLSKLTLARMDSGVTYLHVTRNGTLGGTENENVVLRGRINNIRVPMTCLPTGENTGDDDPNVIPQTENYNCFYEGRLFEDGSQWTAEHDSCMMCSCQRGRVVCEPVICPRLHCSDKVSLSGECCPSCPDNNIVDDRKDNISRGCYIEGDKKWHQAGTIWHPYIPPFGFSVCAVCKCDARTLQVTCDKITCPALPCAEKDTIRMDPQDCCKVCAVSPSANPSISTKSGDILRDEGSAKNNTDLLSEGGCLLQGKVYANGEEWHPRLQIYGEEKCVLCSCKDGIAKCRRQKCPVLTCESRIEVLDQCCQRCADGSNNSPVHYRHKGGGNSKKRRKPKQQTEHRGNQ